jgi:large subunit ribosomal protein L10
MPAKWKFKEVEELTKLVKESPVVAIANITGLPSKQMQQIRAKLHGQLIMKVVKNRLAAMAFEKAGVKGIKDLESKIDGPTALIFSKENPFKLYQQFKSSRAKAPAKGGQTAPHDIVVPAGDTPFKPGPIIGDLQAVGIKAKIQGPIIAVIQDSPVIKEGEKFSAQLASVLAQLEILPMEIGVNVIAVLEDGIVYGSDVLDVSVEDTIANIAKAHQSAVNLAVETGYPTKETIEIMIAKAARSARNLAIEAEIYNKGTVDYFLSKGDREAKSLASEAGYVPGAKPVEEKKEKTEAEAPAAEEKKDEAPSVDKSADQESKEGEALADDAHAEQEENAEEKLIEEADPLVDAPKEEPKADAKESS